MKPAALISGAVAIAAVSGTGGFYLGRNQYPPNTGAGIVTPRVEHAGGPSSGSTRRTEIPRTDFRSFRAELELEADPLKRFNLALKNLESWINADPKGALDWLKSQQPSGRRNETIPLALLQFAEKDPKGAADWALANLTGTDLHNTLIRITEQWAEQDGSGAANWLWALPAGQERDAAMEGVFFAWASNDPAAALDFINKHPGSEELASILRHATFAGWAKTDPQAAVAASLESSRVHQDPGQFANTLANWATIDLAASSEWLLANVKSGDERASAIRELASLFASQSPEAGLAWIGKLNAGAERDLAVNELASEWAAADPAAAAKWAATQNAGNLTEKSVSEILHNFMAGDEAAFNSWRTALSPGPLKEQAQKLADMVGEE